MSVIELMVVVAIIGIIAGLAAFSLRRMGPRANFNSSASDIIGGLNEARQRAQVTQHDVWFILYVSGDNAPIANGGYVIYQDPQGDFDYGTYSIGGSGAQPQGAGDVVVTARYFQDPPYNRGIRFAAPAGSPRLGGPFGNTISAACNFCGSRDGETQGAIRFRPTGEAHLFQADGARSSQMSGVLGLSSTIVPVTETGGIGIATATGMVRLTRFR